MPKSEKAIDPRVDEYAANMFGSMGYDRGKLPDPLVSLYNTVKSRKDKIMPGRMSAEGFSFLTVLVEMFANEPAKTKE